MTQIFKKTLGVCAVAGMLMACNDFKTQTDANGSKYQIHDTKNGKKIKEGDIVSFNLKIKDGSDTTYRDTYKEGKPFQMVAQKGQFKGSFETAIMGLAEGDSATIYVPADSLFTKMQQPLPPSVAKGSDMRFIVKITKVQTKDDYQKEMEGKKNNESKIMADFIAKNQPKAVKSADGIYKTILKEGSGATIQKGQTAVVHYTGKLMNGMTFDSSVGKDPFPVTIGTGSVIPGWEEVLLTMKKGEKAWVFIPSTLAYGEQGAGGVIEPFSPLVFEIEVMDIK